MEKYINLNEYDTIQVMVDIDREMYETELPLAVMANNAVAVNHMISRVDDPIAHVADLMSITNDVLVAEVLLEAINFKVFRRLNSCLSKIKSLQVLHYLLNHDYAQFNMAHKKSECIRLATLDNDYERVKCFIHSRNFANYSLTRRGLNTLDKCCVELAFYNGNDEMLMLFINSGSTYWSDEYSDSLKQKLTDLQNNTCRSKMSNKRKLFEMFDKDKCMDIDDLPDDVLNLAFPECKSNKRLCKLKAERLIASVYQPAAV